MRTKELLKRIGTSAPCLACEPILGKMQQEGLSDFVYAIRRMADQLWGSIDINEEEKTLLNNELAALVRRMSGEEERKHVNMLIEKIGKTISNAPSLTNNWTEIKEVIGEAMNSVLNKEDSL